MESFSWKILCKDPIKIRHEFNLLISRSKIARDMILTINPNTKKKCNEIIELLADDTFEFNTFHSLSKLLKLVSDDSLIRQLWSHIDNILTENADRYNCDVEIYKTLSKIPRQNLEQSDHKFIEKIISCYIKNGINDKTYNTLKNIKTYETQLLENPSDCKIFHKLLKFRHLYSNLLNHDNYMEVKSHIDISHLLNILKKIIVKSNDLCYKELSQINKFYGKSKIDVTEIETFINKSLWEFPLDLDMTLTNIFDIICDIFLIDIININKSNKSNKSDKTNKSNTINISNTTWSDDCDLYVVKKNNEIYGHIYVDMKKREGKINKVVSINLNEGVVYPYDNNIIKNPVTVIIGNYDGNINYKDVIDIFRELGNIIHILFVRSKFGLHLEQDMTTIMSNLFEHIACDIDNIKKISNKYYQNIDNIIMLDNGFKVKSKCVNVLYDYYVHSQENINNNLLDKYNEIMKYVFNKSYELITPLKHIPYSVICELIFNGGILYTDINNMILTFNLYNIIKNNPCLITGFIDDVLKNNDSFKISLYKFIESNNNNDFYCGLKNIEYSISDINLDKLSEDFKKISHSDHTNYFTER